MLSYSKKKEKTKRILVQPMKLISEPKRTSEEQFENQVELFKANPFVYKVKEE